MNDFDADHTAVDRTPVQEDGTPETVTVSWHCPRVALDPATLRDPSDGPDAQTWPTRVMPAKPLKPGHGLTRHSGQIRAFAIFGLDDERMKTALRLVRLQVIGAQDFVPLILTDSRLHSLMRRAGVLVEYFPAAIYMREGATAYLNRRFKTVWVKWASPSLIDLGKPGLLRGRLDDYDSYIAGKVADSAGYSPRRAAPPPAPPPLVDVGALKAEYRAKGLDHEPDSFVLYRILGNDLPPRHEEGQTIRNLRFILEHEAAFANCEKRWVLNRIVDKAQEREFIDLLEAHGHDYLHIPFELDAYRRVEWDLESFPDRSFFLDGRFAEMSKPDQLRAEAHARRHKNRYVMNNNGARNAALAEGRERAKWVLPWDGNCFITKEGWDAIATGIKARPYLKYVTVPMARMTDNATLLEGAAPPEAMDEPQIIFRKDAVESFDEFWAYGRRPKVELLWRLGIAGPWDAWGSDDVWDLPRPARSPEAGSSGSAGWVARLASGRTEFEAADVRALRDRGTARSDGIVTLLDQLDREALFDALDPAALTAYDADMLASLSLAPHDTNKGLLRERLLQEAQLALQRGPYSVIEKSTVPPSGDKHDYYHPAPYWWPNPHSQSGLPFTRRDGERAPGTRLYEPESERYDRTRLQRMFDDTTILALAAAACGRDDCARHAAQLIRHWFLNPDTRMNPNLTYAQVAPGSSITAGSGLIEMKDMYFLLDAVRLMEGQGALSQEDGTGFRAWLRKYVDWLLTSEQGLHEQRANNNHGTCYDLQVGAIAAFLGDAEMLASTLRRSRERLLGQFGNDGGQPHELERTQTQHYCFFNLQCWVHLATLAESCGDRLWYFADKNGPILARAVKWLVAKADKPKWPHAQIEPFDADRILPLIYTAQARYLPREATGRALSFLRKPLFYPHDGIVPFWMLSRPVHAKGEGTDAELAKPIAARVLAEQAKREGPIERVATDRIEHRLWRGFADTALEDLKRLQLDPNASTAELEIAAWALARWHGSNGAFEEALAQVTEAMAIGGAEKMKYLLLKVRALSTLGRWTEARALCRAALDRAGDDSNLFLLMASTFAASVAGASEANEQAQLSFLNKLFRTNGLAGLEKGDAAAPLSLGNIRGAGVAPMLDEDMVDAKVSVVMPVYNGSDTIGMAIRGLQEQSFGNLEIIVVDDCSTDATRDIVAAIAAQDARVRLMAMPRNGGAYVARNAGMAVATGPYVTVHDSDDWSHPQKIETQIRYLRQRPGARAVISYWARVRDDLHAEGNWRPEDTLFTQNPSSFLMPKRLLDEIGCWDSVRVGADNEFLWRFRTRFGDGAIVETPRDLPLSLSLVRDESLTRQSATNVKTTLHGLRRDYQRTYRRWQDKLEGAALKMPSGDSARPFDAPGSILPDQTDSSAETVVIADFSIKGPGVDLAVEVLKREVANGVPVAIFHWRDYENDFDFTFHPEVCELLDAGNVKQVSAFTQASAERIVLCDPYLAVFPIEGVPDFRAKIVEILCVYAGSQAVALDSRRRRMPTLEQLGRIFDTECRWENLELCG